MNPRIFKTGRANFLFYLTVVILLAIIVYLLAPDFFFILFQIFRTSLILLVGVFVVISILVLVGKRKQAQDLIIRIIDGSLTSIDIYETLKKNYRKFLAKLKALLKNLAPLYALLVNVYLYFFLIFIFKYVGSMYDVTIFTIVLTFVLVLVSAFLTRPNKQHKDFDSFKTNFIANFTDFFELMLLVFFLTIDREHLFFLPEELSTDLVAKIGDYDLMVIGIDIYNNFNTTLNIILFIVIIEVFRNALGFYILARKYRAKLEKSGYSGEESILKVSIKQSLHTNIDDIIKFVTYITFTVFVFLFFPRLKLLALAVTSFAALIADLVFTERLTATTEKKQDLLGRVLAKIFRI